MAKNNWERVNDSVHVLLLYMTMEYLVAGGKWRRLGVKGLPGLGE